MKKIYLLSIVVILLAVVLSIPHESVDPQVKGDKAEEQVLTYEDKLKAVAQNLSLQVETTTAISIEYQQGEIDEETFAESVLDLNKTAKDTQKAIYHLSERPDYMNGVVEEYLSSLHKLITSTNAFADYYGGNISDEELSKYEDMFMTSIYDLGKAEESLGIRVKQDTIAI